MDEVTHKKNFKPIIIRYLFMDKSPKIARWIPGFVYRLLSLMLRIDFMNDPILYQTFDKRFTPIQWASQVQNYTYSLAEDPDGELYTPKQAKLSS